LRLVNNTIELDGFLLFLIYFPVFLADVEAKIGVDTQVVWNNKQPLGGNDLKREVKRMAA
jgi:hypothetical protein